MIPIPAYSIGHTSYQGVHPGHLPRPAEKQSTALSRRILFLFQPMLFWRSPSEPFGTGHQFHYSAGAKRITTKNNWKFNIGGHPTIWENMI